MSEPLSHEEKATNYETMKHIRLVGMALHKMAAELLKRADAHDQSKLKPPEVALFAEYTPLLAASTYGSPEYEEFRNKLKPALDHHYAKNRHHPEHFDRGVRDMNLVDLLEMFCDWKAATLRHHDGNIRLSIEKNATRFNLPPALVDILKNTADLLDDIKEDS